MPNKVSVLIAIALSLIAVPAVAQHHDYNISVSNHTQQDLHITCHDDDTGEEDTSDVHAGQHANLSVHGGEHVHVHCTASDHDGNELASREFEFNHRRRANRWTLRDAHDHHH